MEFKQLTINLEDTLINDVEKVLDNIGLDTQSAIRMFFKKVVNERNINFLIMNATAQSVWESTANNSERQIESDVNAFDEFTALSNERRFNGTITREMRDYLWLVFKQHKQKNLKADNQAIAKMISEKTGMNSGSAFIYLNLLESWFAGKDNTRTMKYDDLVYYVQAIKREFPARVFDDTISALEQSIPYWKQRLNGNFGTKVEQLIKQYKL